MTSSKSVILSILFPLILLHFPASSSGQSLATEGSSNPGSGNVLPDWNPGAAQHNYAVAPPFPILRIGTDYILGQGGAHGAKNGFLSRRAGYTRYIPLQKRVDGPIQCGPGNPCADGSCCNSVST